jgi:predicted Zn finger-like uncharacterized protein
MSTSTPSAKADHASEVYELLPPKQDQRELEHGRLARTREEGDEPLGPITGELSAIPISSGEQLADPSAQRSSGADRIAAVCPGCQATLRVRREYIGSEVKCKHCGHIFPITAPAGIQSEPVENSKHEQLLDEHDWLMAVYGPLEPKHDQREIERGRLAPAREEVDEPPGPITGELSASSISSAEQLADPSAQRSSGADRIAAVCPGCQANLSVRRAYIGSEVKCKHCGHTFPIAAPDVIQSEPVQNRKREQLLDEHAPLMDEHRQLQAKYDELEVENGRLTTAQNDLSEQLSRVTDELNANRAELEILAPAGVRSLAEQRDSLRAEVQRVQEEHRSTQELCKQLQDRDTELTDAQKQLEISYQSMLDAERMEKATLAKQLDELRALAAERAGLAEPTRCLEPVDDSRIG